MESENISDVSNYTDVRYNKVYSIIIISASIPLIILLILSDSYYSLLLFGPLLIQGILALAGRKYLRHDKQNKTFKIDIGIGFYYKKYIYDRIYFKGVGATRSLYIEINNKKKYISMAKYICNKSDYEAFNKEIVG